jgi:hypothetical protein
MTIQFSDRLSNECEEVDLWDFGLYGVRVGDITTNHGWGEPYPLQALPTDEKRKVMTCNWRGYICAYRLRFDGELILERFEYPAILPEVIEPDLVEEKLTGDFWLVMKEQFSGLRTYIPFKDGHIVTDKSQWIVEERPEPEQPRRKRWIERLKGWFRRRRSE